VKRIRVTLTLFVLLTLASIASAAESKPPWRRDWEKIREGAKKEGEVRLWREQEIAHPDILAAFNKGTETR
jgi:hypothetical protein